MFFGANSSGKSSIGQFLMMLKQTVESADRRAPFYPGEKNSAVQLGSYQEMVFGRDPKAHGIAFEYRWSLAKKMEVMDPLTHDKKNGNELYFKCAVASHDAKNNAPCVENFSYTLGNENTASLSISLAKISEKPEYEIRSEEYNFIRKKMRAWALKNPVRFYGFPDETLAYYENAGFLQDLNLQQENLFRSIFYLGPLRTKAARLYTWGGNAPESVGFSGENAIAALLAAGDRTISSGKGQRKKPLKEFIAEKLQEMGLIEDFLVQRISDNRQEYEVNVRIPGSESWVDLHDVGFGISQVLPVLVQCFYAPPGSIIIMEQSEIHLHPRAQSALADIMITAIHAREKGKNSNIQLIIETHSEHFLRRLQRRIAENPTLTTEKKVSVYFADTEKTPTTLSPLHIDDAGHIRNWPKNFFGDEMEDIIAQSKAAIQARSEKQKKSRKSA